MRTLKQPKPWLPTLSLEEEDVMIQEASDSLMSATNLIHDTERSLQIAEGLDDTVAVIQTIPEATETHVELVNLASQMAVAGTDVDPVDMVPAMEQYIGTTISVEGIVETAKKIWEFIVELVQKIVDAITNFFMNLFGKVSRTKRKLVSIQTRLGKVKHSNPVMKDKEITVGTNRHLQVGGKLVKDSQEILKGLDGIKTMVDFSFDYVKSVEPQAIQASRIVKDYAEEFLKGVSGNILAGHRVKYDPKMMESTSVSIGAALSSAIANLMPHKVGFHKSNNDDSQTQVGETGEFLGNVQLRVQVPKDRKSNIAFNNGLHDRIRKMGIHMAYVDNRSNVPEETRTTIPTLTIDEMNQNIKSMFAIVDEIERFQKSHFDQKLVEMAKEMKKASAPLKDIHRNVGRSNVLGFGITGADAAMKVIANCNVIVSRWVKEPVAEIFDNALKVTDAVILSIGKSMKAHNIGELDYDDVKYKEHAADATPVVRDVPLLA